MEGPGMKVFKWLGFLCIWVWLPLSVVYAQTPGGADTVFNHMSRQVTDAVVKPNPYHGAYLPALRYTPRQLLTPGVLTAAGIAMDLSQGLKNTQLSFHDAHLRDFHTAADNILLYVPAAIPYGLDLIGIRSKNDIANRTAILIKGEILLTATGYLLKHTIHEWRPDGSNHYSFPSGHTLQVFATATMLSEEYRDKYKWMPYAAYGLATGVGLLRLANNKHYLGDVLVGAGLGILSMKLAYWTHHYSWHKRRKFK